MLMDHQQHVSQLFTAPIKTATRLTKKKLGDSAIVSLHYTSKFIGKIRNWVKMDIVEIFAQKIFPIFSSFHFKKQQGYSEVVVQGTWNIHSFIHDVSIGWFQIFKIQQSLRCTSRPTRHGRNGFAICPHSPWIVQVSMDTGSKTWSKKQNEAKNYTTASFWVFVLGVSTELYLLV